jgi:GMP synthase-like glutamine amidotransferase
MTGRIYCVKHVEDEGPGLIGEFFRDLGVEVVELNLQRGDRLPESLESTAGVVVLGGPMNVYEEEEYPFLKEEGLFIKQVLREEVPFLGICLGGQLLAKACGGAVTKSPHKEIGWYEVELTREGRRDSLFRGLPATLSVFQWHGDTFAVPPGGVLLATGKLCRNQAFRMGSCAYGLQFHAEVTADMVKGWMDKEGPSIDGGRILEEGARLYDAFVAQGRSILANFRRVMESFMRVKRTLGLFVDAQKNRPIQLWWSLEKRTLLAR